MRPRNRTTTTRPPGRPARISWVWTVLAFGGLLWAVTQGLWTWVVLQSDETGGACDVPEPSLAVAAGLAFVFSVTAVGLTLGSRSQRVAAMLAAEAVVSLVWVTLGAFPAVSCVIE